MYNKTTQAQIAHTVQCTSMLKTELNQTQKYLLVLRLPGIKTILTDLSKL
jgi:hypothetical protein